MTSPLRGRLLALFLAVLLLPSLARADWFDDYEDGLKAAEKEQWQVVVQKMNAAIAKKPKEGEKERTYGVQFIAYFPYYYRGVAYFNLGEFQKAADDLGRTTGMGRVKLGNADTLAMKAQARLSASSAPAQPPPAVATAQPPATPATPAVDAALDAARQKANGLLAAADRSRSAAQAQNAPSLAPTQYIQATEALADARTKAPSARSAADWESVADVADRARALFDASVSQAQLQAARQASAPTQATAAVLGDTTTRVRHALEAYFDGKFTESAREFERLANGELRGNSMIWAFLGAAQYSRYYMGGERNPQLRTAATDAFRQSRRLGKGMKELPREYFSPRIRKFYGSVK